MKVYGLIGKSLLHSFSPDYFNRKFENEKITNCIYNLFPLSSIDQFPELIKNNPKLAGLNVTIPYKQSIIPFLNKLDTHAKNIGAVNTIKISTSGNNIYLTGYNTDYLGFSDSIKPFITKTDKNALILGTGGSSVAIAYALKLMGVSSRFVSRNPFDPGIFSYNDIDKDVLKDFKLIINTTPVGMYPNLMEKPEIPYRFLTSNHRLFDLIYNPEETQFLKLGKKIGTLTKNGFEMLGFQADYSWKIWNE